MRGGAGGVADAVITREPQPQMLRLKVGFIIVCYWVTQNLPQICTIILRIRIWKVALVAVYICGNFWGTQYVVSHNVHFKDLKYFFYS